MKQNKAIWFGLSIMAMVVLAVIVLTPWTALTTGHIGLIMLALVVVCIMLGFPTAFTLMGMGVIFSFLAYFMQSGNSMSAIQQTLSLMVQRTYASMTNDALISIPLFVFMGYLVERANLIERLFKGMHLALARVPGSLGVATLATCAIFATATGIVGAVVTLMGLLAMPTMLKAGYSVRMTAGAITAGGCLGILLPPSVLLIVYGATAGVSVVQLYAGAIFPGLMLAFMYVLYVVVVAKIFPSMAPPLPESERTLPLPDNARKLSEGGTTLAMVGLLGGLFKGRRNRDVPMGYMMRNMLVAAMPLLCFAVIMGATHRMLSEPPTEYEIPAELMLGYSAGSGGGLAEPPSGGLAEPPMEGGLSEPPSDGGLSEPPGAQAVAEPPGAESMAAAAAEAGEGATPQPTLAQTDAAPDADGRLPVPAGYWIAFWIMAAMLAVFYVLLTWQRLEILKMLMASFFPLAVLIFAVLGTIVMGLATPSEAAAMGAMGGVLLAAAYRRLNTQVLKESVFLTAKTSAMVCWLFVGSSIFSAAFALLGGQKIIEDWVLSMGLSPVEFMLLAQIIIFLLGWPLEWTEIIVIFMPIFIPLLPNFGIDPLFFGLLVALNLQTAFLSPPVAMSAFYLKGVSPPHVTLNQIFIGMLPFMGIQIVAIFVLYMFPGVGMWLPTVLYR